MSPQEAKLYRGLLLATVGIGAILFFWGLGDIALLSQNEARRAVPAENMIATGDWLLPRLNGELYLAKPPLFYWMEAIVATLFGGASEWAVRLPSALAATAIAVAGYRYALRQFGAWPALFTAQLLIANTTFAMFARRSEIEMLLSALCFSALLAALKYIHGEGGRRWLWVSYFLLGAAILTKGPLALLFVTLPLLAIALVQRQPRHWQALTDPAGWILCLSIGLSWYVLVTWELGLDTWRTIVQRDMVEKISESTGDSPFKYFFALFADFFPGSLVLLAAPLTTWRRWRTHESLVALIIAATVPLLVYTAISQKQAKYLLPIYPLIAILLGKRLGEILEGMGARTRHLLLAAGILMPLGYACYYAAFESRIFAYRVSAFPAFRAWLDSASNHPLHAFGKVNERLVYYAHRDIPLLDQTGLQALHSSGASLYLVVESSGVAMVESATDCRVREFSPYLNSDKSLVVFGLGSACPRSQTGQ